MRAFLTGVLLVCCLPGAAGAQGVRGAAAEGVTVAVRSVDDLERGWGLRDEEVRDAAEKGVRAAGWRVNEHSADVITVEISLLAQIEEDLFPVRISVRASRAEGGDREAREGTFPEVTASRVIAVPWSDRARIRSTVTDLVRSVARKRKADLTR